MDIDLVTVKAYCGVPANDVRDDFALGVAIDGVIAYVRSLCPGHLHDSAVRLWPADIQWAVLRTIQRWHSLRSSPDGLASGLDEGVGAVRVAASDPDVNRVLAPYRTWSVG